jgi:hypothetical protein
MTQPSVVVIGRHHCASAEHVQIVDQADQDGVERCAGAALQQGERIARGIGFDGLDRRREMAQEQPGVGIARVERQPGHPALRARDRREPLRQQRRLAEPGRCRDQNQARRLASVPTQPVRDARPWHQPATPPRRVHLGGQHRHRFP